jgi:sugar phosphate isomerase/epimerase
MRFAIQEDMLPGQTIRAQFEQAQSLGFAGVEVWAAGLSARVPDLLAASEATGVLIAAVNHGQQHDLLHADRDEREQALAELRQSVVDGVDLGAQAVILVPHFGPPTLPDLFPYKSVTQLAHDLLHNHLRTISDYVYALGIDLYIEPVNHYETYFVTKLADAAQVRRRIKDHPHVKISADLYHLALEEADLYGALRQYAADLGYIHLADSNRRLPGQGLLDCRAVLGTLGEVGYDGWVTVSCGRPGHNAPFAAQMQPAVRSAMTTLRGGV